ncbi:hypothetical protein L1987_21019 [Smallanthus sonchifolius]|uniref:Uncharacterized protein n=1 Tax=Smallanthus sonchifolius TaxID=185202 RepID=A0ACB9ISU3_9ASTR|nr:hypothetical protein L1987_21019 [Smallanthus sonchifolius]
MIGANRKDWSDKLDDALWAFRTAFRTSTGSTPFRLIYGKTCHFPVELEHRAYWALRTVNLDEASAGEKRMFELHELEELRDLTYAHVMGYKAKTKELHDRHLKNVKSFECGDQVLLYISRLRLFPGNLKSRWMGPFVVKEVFPYGTVKIEEKNGHRLKHYISGSIAEKEDEVIYLEPLKE